MTNRPTHDAILTQYARLLGPSLGMFIAEDVFPAVAVPSQRGNNLDVQGGFAAASPGNRVIRADGQERPDTINIKISEQTGWYVEQNGVGAILDGQTADYYRKLGLNAEEAVVGVLARYNRILRERTAEAIAFSTTVFTGHTSTLSGSDQWSDSASNPVSDAQDAKEHIRQNCGEEPTAAVMGAAVHKKLRQHPMVVEYASRTRQSVGLINDAMVAEALDVERIYVGKAVANSAVPNLTASNADIWGKHCLFAVLRQSPSPMSPQSCLQRWRLEGSLDGSINRYPLPGNYVEQIDQLWTDQFAAPTTACGYLYENAVA